MTHIVKRKGHTEPFDPRKVYASVYAACRNAHLSEAQAEKIAAAVQDALEKWISPKTQVGSREIFEKVTKVLKKLHQDAGFLYQSHRDIS